MAQELVRIAIFYDGTFFSKISDYYRYSHPRRARISIYGLHNFIRHRVAEFENLPEKLCQVVDAHYFRGRYSAQETRDYDPNKLFGERQFDDVLMNAGVVTHYLPIIPDRREKGIDVWLALEAFELAQHKHFSVLVLIAGDGDFLPLIRKLHTLGIKVMLLSWDLIYTDGLGEAKTTRTAQSIMEEATYLCQMEKEIDDRKAKTDPILANLFLAPVGPAEPKALNSTASEESIGVTVKGTIKNLNDSDKGRFGFIAGEDGRDYFLHPSNLAESLLFEDLYEGLRIFFEVGEKLPGKPFPPAKGIRLAPGPRDDEDDDGPQPGNVKDQE